MQCGAPKPTVINYRRAIKELKARVKGVSFEAAPQAWICMEHAVMLSSRISSRGCCDPQGLLLGIWVDKDVLLALQLTKWKLQLARGWREITGVWVGSGFHCWMREDNDVYLSSHTEYVQNWCSQGRKGVYKQLTSTDILVLKFLHYVCFTPCAVSRLFMTLSPLTKATFHIFLARFSRYHLRPTISSLQIIT